MATPFDRLADNAFGLVAGTMGREMSWFPPVPDNEPALPPVVSRVLFAIEPRSANMASSQFVHDGPWMEWQEEQLPGFYRLVSLGDHQDVTIYGTPYRCTNVVRKDDGRVLVGYLTEMPA